MSTEILAAREALVKRDNEIARLAIIIQKISVERDFYKHLADRNHRANMKPCSRCGYKQEIIKGERIES